MKRLFLLLIAAFSFAVIYAQPPRQQARRQILGSYSYNHPGYTYRSSRSYNAYVYRRRPVTIYRRNPNYWYERRGHDRGRHLGWYKRRWHRHWD